jgi:hypothetical protein
LEIKGLNKDWSSSRKSKRACFSILFSIPSENQSVSTLVASDQLIPFGGGIQYDLIGLM